MRELPLIANTMVSYMLEPQCDHGDSSRVGKHLQLYVPFEPFWMKEPLHDAASGYD